ncbi:MAG TPA: OmpA family protein [Polyangiaceae bacterium]
MARTSLFLVGLLSAALAAPALAGCTASASMNAGAATPPATPPPPPPPVPAPAPTPTPAPPPPVAAPTAAVVKGDTIQIPGKIEFDTGKATFKAGSTDTDNVITQLKAYLDANPKVTKLRIEGHTDNVGTPDANLTLSGQRALTVKNALIAKGEKKERLLAVGFGQNKPIKDNATDEGRSENRRTEFHIAEINGKKYLGLDPAGGGKVFE